MQNEAQKPTVERSIDKTLATEHKRLTSIMKSTWKVHNPSVIILLMCSQLSYFKILFEQDSGHLVQHDNNYYTIDHTIS